MKVLADIRLLAKGGASGIEEYTKGLLGAVLEQDKNNEYSLFYNGFRKHPIPKEISTAGKVVDWRIPNKILDASFRFLNYPKIDEATGADLIFSPHFNILKSRKAPRIITIHDLSFMHHPDFFSLRQKVWHWFQDVRRQTKEADRIIAVSEFTKSDLINLLDVPEEKIKVIYSGVSEGFHVMDSKQTTKPYILYLGTLEPRKNIVGLIRAFNILKQGSDFKDWQLVLAGKAGWLYENILAEAKKSPYSGDIVFKGSVGSAERVSLYNSAKVFVYPSFFEGFGFPPLEAQACGCPVVVSDRTSLPEVLKESALYVNPWKAEDMAQAISRVVGDDELRNRLIKEGRANSSNYRWEKAAEETIKLFDLYA